MMVTIGVYVRRGQRTLRRWLMDPRIHALLECGAYILAGMLLSAASLASRCLPLTLGLLCALSGWPALLMAAGGMGGYLLFWGAAGAQGVVWLMIGLMLALILGERPFLKETPLLMPALAALTVALTGLCFQLWWGDTTPVATYLLRVLLAMVATALFTVAAERRDPMVDWAVCGLAVLALAQVAPVAWLNLGYITGAALCCVGAFPAAALAGLALDLAQITPVPMTAVLSLAYLLRLLPWGPKKVYYAAPAAVYLLIMTISGTWELAPVTSLLLGGAVALILPGKVGLSQRRGETGVAQVRLELTASVLAQTGELMHLITPNPIDETALISRAAERACGGCPCRKNCRVKAEDISTELLHKPLGNGADLPVACRKSGRLLQELRRSQEQLRTIRADRDRQQEYRSAVAQQYGFLSDYLQDVADSLAQRTNPPKQWYQPEIAVCSASRERENGDRCLWFAGVACRYYILLCDGMGTGEEAYRAASATGNLLRKLLSAGFPPEHALRSVNSICALQGQAGAVTIDLCELRLDTGKAALYKWGAAASYVIARGEPIKIGTASPPPGLSVTDGRETVEKLSLRKGETLVLLSDGAGGEEALRLAWVRAGEPVGELASRILASGEADGSDDATVAVVRLSRTSMPA